MIKTLKLNGAQTENKKKQINFLNNWYLGTCISLSRHPPITKYIYIHVVRDSVNGASNKSDDRNHFPLILSDIF